MDLLSLIFTVTLNSLCKDICIKIFQLINMLIIQDCCHTHSLFPTLNLLRSYRLGGNHSKSYQSAVVVKIIRRFVASEKMRLRTLSF